jgi:hypothetical protein
MLEVRHGLTSILRGCVTATLNDSASGTSGGGGGGAIADALWQELKPLANPIPRMG